MTAVGRAIVVAPGEGEPFRIGPDRFVRKGDRGERADGFAVIEYEGAAGVPGPPPHVHRTFEEAWFILEGEVAFTAGSQRHRAVRGSYILVPRGVPHTFEVVGNAPARWIGIFSPGRYVRLVEELGALLPAQGPPDLAKVDVLFARYDTEAVGPG